MAVAAPPVALDEPQVVSEPIEALRPAHRWGPPIWAADEPLVALDKASPTMTDTIVLSIIVAHTHE